MQLGDLIRVGVFLALVVVVYAYAARALVSLVRKRALPRGGRAFLALAAVGTLCVLYGFFIEPYWLETTHVALASSKLAKPIRIAHLSDLHCDPTPRLEERLPDAVAAEKPDVIVFTGDATNSPGGVPILQRLLRRLSALAPTFVVRGNWDLHEHRGAWGDERRHEAIFDGTGVTVLEGDAAPLRSDVWVVGVRYGAPSTIAPALAKVPKGAYSVFLCHTPDEIEAVAALGADLYLCGHTHGGQVALPFFGALATCARTGKQFESGLHRVGATEIYTNRGIGMDGLGAPRVRFCARPELTIIEVKPR